MTTHPAAPVACSISPWLTVKRSEQAVAFYKKAFDAEETYRLGDPEGHAVVQLSIGGATFWVSDGDPQDSSLQPLGGGSIRLVLILSDPQKVFARAIAVGAEEVFPVGVQHGWRLGRLKDPFGLHWEIGHPVA